MTKHFITPCRALPIIIVLITSILSAQNQQTIAVLEFEGFGISTSEVAALTNRLRTELVLSNAVTVVERGQMEQILLEQDFQMIGCTSNDCVVEVGQLLGVNAMVAGSLGKVGSTFTTDFRIIDVTSGRITYSLKKNYRGEIDDLLDLMIEISAELVGALGGSQIVETPAPVFTTATIKSSPPGASISLNGRHLGLTRVDNVICEKFASRDIRISYRRAVSTESHMKTIPVGS